VSAARFRKVFLSVAGPDAAWGDRIDRRLRDAGLEVEYYRRSFPQGRSFVREINSALASCDCMVALFSPAYGSPRSWVTEEWQAALVIDRQRPGFLAPFLIEQCQLPPLLAPLNYVNLTGLKEEEAEGRLLAELQNKDWARPAPSGARGPADSTWAAAIHRSERDGLPLGAGVVIDKRRVLTSARVVTENGEVLDPLPWVAFPLAGPPDPPRREVVAVRLSADKPGLAVLDLGEVVPAGVSAAPLRRPRPQYLTETGWWSFGFPAEPSSGLSEDDEEGGGYAEGEVDATVLARGVLGLKADLRGAVRAGFSGAGLWSPDYEAVTGIISRVDGEGTGRAVTVYRADLCFVSDRLSTLTGWSPDQAGEVAIQAWGWAPQRGGYRFRGRDTALAEIAGWLDRDRPDPRALVVTGAPGVGKSAVLGRIVTTADPLLRAGLPAGDPAVRATEGSVACAVHAAGKTAREVAEEIARAFSAKLPPLNAPLDKLAPAVSEAAAEQGLGRLNLVIDALDEASRPADTRLIVTQIVRPLLDAGAQVVVGSRPRDNAGDILAAFDDAVTVIDLDAAEYYLQQDVEAYVLATLQQLGAEQRPNNPYADDEAARPLAAKIAELSRGNFLIAGLTAQSHAKYDQRPADPRELAAFSQDAKTALYEALERAFKRGEREAGGISVATALATLTALAFSEAPGLSCELWSVAIESLPDEQAPARLEETQLARFARSVAGSFVVESVGQDSEAVFGLFHQALNDALLYRRAQRATSVTGDPIKEDQQALTRAFLRHGRQAGWASAPPYLLRSLAHHAEPAGLLDELLADDDYLLYADLRRLTPLAAAATTRAGKERAALLRLTPYAAATSESAKRRALFSVTETLEKLGDNYRADPGPAPYRARWSTVSTHAERVTQEGHAGGVGMVCSVVLDGKIRLVSGGDDEILRIWDPASGRQLRTLEGHAGEVNDLHAFTTKDGRTLLASTGGDAMVRIWDPATGEQQRMLEGHTGPVTAVCSFPDEDGRTLLASTGADAMVRIWDPATGEQQRMLKGHTRTVNDMCSFRGEDGRRLLASAGEDGTIRVWDPASGELRRILERPTAAEDDGTTAIMSVCAFTGTDGRPRLASVSGGAAGEVGIWDPGRGHYQAIEGGTTSSGAWQIYPFTADGRVMLAAAGSDDVVRIWDAATGQRQRVIEASDEVWSVCSFPASDGGTLLASAGLDPTIQIWDPATGEQQQALKGHSGAPWSVCSFPGGDGRTLLASAGDVVRIWDAATGQLHHSLPDSVGGTRSVCAFRVGDGRTLLASAGTDAIIRIWDPATGLLQRSLEGSTGKVWNVCAFPAADGRTLLASSGLGVVRIWDPLTGQLVRALKGHAGQIWDLCPLVTASGKALLVSTGDDGTVRVWDPDTGLQQRALPSTTEEPNGATAFTGEDGRSFVAIAEGDGTIPVFDVATGELERTLAGHGLLIRTVSTFTLAGRTLLASCGDDGEVRVWDPAAEQILQAIPVHLTPNVAMAVDGILVVGLTAGLLAIELNLPG
jgi:WD40 repeat protein